MVAGVLAAGAFFLSGEVGPNDSTERLDEKIARVESEPTPRATAALSERESHARMVETLARIGKGTATRNPYLGRAMADRIVDALGKLGPAAPARQRWELNLSAGESELQLGNLRAAIEYLSAANDLLPLEGLDAQAMAYNKFKLGVAYMRLGETQNCCAANEPESCILPIRGGGLHTKTEGSSYAIEYFEAVLAADVGEIETRSELSNSASNLRMNLAAQWLLNIAYMTLDLYPDGVPPEYLVPVESFESGVEFPRFENISKALGLDT